MPRPFGRRLLWVYAFLLLVVAYGYARYDAYIMDGDGTAFLDIAQDLNTHRAGLAINGYWNPGYPAVVALVERVTHPDLWHELSVLRYTNLLIFAFAMAASVFFTTGLVKARMAQTTGTGYALPEAALHLLGLGMLTLSLGRELPVAAPRSDTLLFALLLLAAGVLLRLLVQPRPLWLYPTLGGILGLAYLTKSFAFLPSVALVAGFGVVALLDRAHRRVSAMAGVLMMAAVFAAIAGPYVWAVSRQLGHFSTGESARLNYAFFVDLTPRWHEWFHRDLGHASGVLVHPEAVLLTSPPTFSYAAHPYGTYPLWFDPAWWTLGLKPHIWLKGHVLRLARNVELFVRYLLGRPEIFVLLGVVLAFGARWPRWRTGERGRVGDWRTHLWYAVPLAWGLLMLAIYFPVDLQDRYLTAPLFLVVVPLFACLRAQARDEMGQTAATPDSVRTVAGALVLLFALLALSQGVTYVAERRRHVPTAEQRHPGFDPQIFTAAAALRKLGVGPGDKVACMGDVACYTDFYWARLAGTQILGEVETPDEANPATVWKGIPDKQAVTGPLARLGLRAIVSLMPNSASKPAGWIQLGNSNFFAYLLQGAVTPAQAAAAEEYKAVP